MTKEIWRDEKTGLPIHCHPVAASKKHDDGTTTWGEMEPKFKPCDCKWRVHDIPSSAVQQSNKTDQQEQRPLTPELRKEMSRKDDR